MQPLKITVVTVSYNAAATIEETILSVVDQTYDNIEYIVIDGGSTDGTVDIIKRYSEGGSEYGKHNNSISYWISEPDKGIYDAMNKGIAAATGDYIINMNAGDRLIHIPHKALKNILFNNSIGICGAITDEFGKIHTPNLSWRNKYRNQLPHQGLFYKRQYQKLYDIRYHILGDFDLNLSYLHSGAKFDLINNIIAEHSFDGISNSKKTNSECYEIVKKYYGIIGTIGAFLYFKASGLKKKFAFN